MLITPAYTQTKKFKDDIAKQKAERDKKTKKTTKKKEIKKEKKDGTDKKK